MIYLFILFKRKDSVFKYKHTYYVVFKKSSWLMKL